MNSGLQLQPLLDSSTAARSNLVKLLQCLEWKGSHNELLSYLPAGDDTLTLDQLRDVLFKAGYLSQLRRCSSDVIPLCDLPTLAVRKDGSSVLLRQQGLDQLCALSGDAVVELDPRESLQWLELQPKPRKPSPKGTWFQEMLGHYNASLVAVLILSLANAVLGLALPLFTMSVYDFLIPSGSLSGLGAVGSGAIIALVWIVVCNRIRARMLSQLAANMSYQVGRSMFAKLVGAPAEFLLSTTAFQNMARIRSIDQVREFLGGIMAASLFDAPFVVVALVAIGWLSGWLVLVPLFGGMLYGLLLLYFNAQLNRASAHSARVGQRMQEQVRQALDGLVELREAEVHSHWLQRFAQESIVSARAGFNYRMASALQQTVGKLLNMLIALATLMCGIYFVLSGVMSAGGLIAAMMLIWRVTGPLQMAFLSATRFRQFKQSVQQINAIMDSPWENAPEKVYAPLQQQRPALTLERLVYRFASDRDAALNGISLNIESGKKVAVVGPNGSGKSTLLACMAGVLHPQSGVVQMDGHDIRQFKTVDYRNRLAYITDELDFLEGTIAENLRAAAPLATADQMQAALAEFAVADVLVKNYQGLDTPVMQNGALVLDRMLGLAIKLARARLRDPDLYLLDDLFIGGDHPVMKALQRFMSNLPANKTLVYTTHDKDLMLQGDLAVIMEKGTVSQVAELNKNENQNEQTNAGEKA